MRLFLRSLIGGTLATSIIGGASVAFAFWARVHPVHCRADDTYSTYGDGMWLTNPGNTGHAATVHCPLPDDSNMPATSITGTTVNLWSAQGWSDAQICVTFWGGGGGACGPYVQQYTSTGGGTVQLSIPSGVGAWLAANYPYDYPYVQIAMPQALSGYQSSLNGVFVWQ